MSSYTITVAPGNILKVSFGEPAGNDRIVRDADSELQKLIQSEQVKGGKLLKINGPASMPVAMLLGHRLAHLYEIIACFDPKLGKYVVVSSHGVDCTLGDLLD